MRILSFISLLLFFFNIINAQIESPYHTSWKQDGPWIGAALVGTAGGVYIISKKNGISESNLSALNENSIWAIDRWSTGTYDEHLSKISDIPFAISFAVPIGLMATKREWSHVGQISVLYLETMLTTGAAFSLTAGLTNRIRPKTYSDDYGTAEKLKSTNTRSFYSGHTAAAASATFFAAKVYSDFYPNGKSKGLIWAGAVIIPAAVGALRIAGGQHFLSDVVVGYGLGALTGILIPHLHLKENPKLTFNPIISHDIQGLSLRYSIR